MGEVQYTLCVNNKFDLQHTKKQAVRNPVNLPLLTRSIYLYLGMWIKWVNPHGQ